ncbi:MAG: ABC transporter ATP-binding protein/permease [Rhizobiaceae bacterium]|nr:ABC transporter ATP-binding protein/permease [Rhizobiaceae bacterium]
MFSYFEKRIDPFPERGEIAPPKEFVAFCWHYTKDAWPWILAISALGAFIAVAEVALFGFMGSLVDWLSASDREGFLQREAVTLFWMGALLLVALPLAELLHGLIFHQTLLGNYPMIARWLMHKHLLGHSMNFFANEFAGRIATKVMQTSMGVREAVLIVMDILVYVAVYFAAMFFLIAQADFRLVLPMFLWMFFYVAIIWYFVPKLRNASKNQADARSTMTGRIVDSYTNITTMKLFSHTGREAHYAREGMDDFLQTVHIQMRLVTLFRLAIFSNNTLVIFLISTMAIWLWQEQAISVGAVAIAISLVLRLSGMSQWVMWQVSALFEHIGVIHDGMTMMTKDYEVIDDKNSKPIAVNKGAIDFNNIRFHYGKDTGVIENLNLSIAAGEKIGLVGRSGAGKTTLTNVLLRFYDLEGGEILIDGTNIAKVTQDSLRAQIGVVTQDTSLLHRSIRENIAYSKPDASDEDVISAAKRANAWEFIETLEDQKGRKGLDAQVGERGVKLSGGQRQRIAIARIFLKDAPILVLDEATSALDSEVEAAIQENLFALMENKTVIAIAHRLSTISELDRLIVMDEGAIVETGTHNELVSQGGIYADLWNRQSGGFIATPQKEEIAE